MKLYCTLLLLTTSSCTLASYHSDEPLDFIQKVRALRQNDIATIANNIASAESSLYELRRQSKSTLEKHKIDQLIKMVQTFVEFDKQTDHVTKMHDKQNLTTSPNEVKDIKTAIQLINKAGILAEKIYASNPEGIRLARALKDVRST
jgi:hypothetical protein